MSKQAVYSLSQKLELEVEKDGDTQDWQHYNADPERLEEFMDLYSSEYTNSEEKFKLMELILSSLNQMISNTDNEPKEWRIIKQMLSEDIYIHDITIKHWISLADDFCDGFELSSYMKQIEHLI